MDDGSVLLHATAVRIGGSGVMLTGKSGSGKSDLALRLIDRGAELISDDIVRICEGENGPRLHPAPNIAGKMEIYGLGIINTGFCADIPLHLVIALGGAPDTYNKRMPDPVPLTTICKFDIPTLHFDPFHGSTAIKIEHACKMLVDENIRPVAQKHPVGKNRAL